MLQLINFLNQTVYIDSDDADVFDTGDLAATWGDDYTTIRYRADLNGLTVHVMSNNMFYTHHPPTLLSPSMVVILKFYADALEPTQIRVFPRLNYPASPPAETIGWVQRYTDTPKNITLHNIGNDKLNVTVGKKQLCYVLDNGESLPVSTKKIVVSGYHRYLYIKKGMVRDSNTHVKYNYNDDKHYFIDSQREI